MVSASASSPLGTLLLMFAAARRCAGFRPRTTVGHRTSPSSTSRGALPPHVGRSMCRNRSSSSSSSSTRRLRTNADDGSGDADTDDDEISIEGGGRRNDDEDDDDDDEKKRAGLTWEEIMSDPELRKIEYDSSVNRKNAMLLPQRISAAVTTLGWIFVVCGVVLNQLGYAYVKDPAGGIRIGSLDERDFQVEVVKEGRRRWTEEDAKKGGGEGSPTPSITSRPDDSNSRIFSWIERETQKEEERG
ncbi:hypothetical protein ACHAW5_010305 [Stephanodiscus triporus]|uniref:Uncharacterized protein n=1 Tax=Stephanodiscus triporus TaxID=2934178 RepID=A0ABD3P7C3_9STRA